MIGNKRHYKEKLLNNYYFFKYFYGLNSIKSKTLKVNRCNDLVIEGFPRSANSYIVFLLQELCSIELHIAHHVHRPTQLILGIEYNIPCVLMIRKPVDACTSFSIRHPNVSIKESLNKYLTFHNELINYRQHIHVISFDDFVADPINTCTERLKDILEFVDLKPRDKNLILKKVIQSIEDHSKHNNKGSINEKRISRPSKIRSLEKKEIIENIYADKYLKELLSKANEIYNTFTGKNQQ